MAKLLRYLLPLVVLGVGYLVYAQFSVKEELKASIRHKRPPIEAETTVLTRTDFRVTLNSQGVVRPHNETSLTSRVSGRIIKISPVFESGSFFKKDDILVELDSSDFLAAVSGAEARLARAEASLAQEEARAKQALLDWNDLGYTEPPTELVLRKPQLKEAKANVKAAQAELSDTTRDLERTKIIAPYAGRVKERLVGLGQSVGPSTNLGDIFSTDFAEVRISLSARELPHVILPNNPDDAPIPVTLTDALAKENPQSWQGSIVRTEGVLDEKSRKLFVIARVDDPFGLNSETPAPLRVGQPIRATLKGELIKNVFVIPRETLRRPNEVILVEPVEMKLNRVVVDPVWNEEHFLVVRDGLTEGWHLVTKRLANAPQGARVTLVDPNVDDEKAVSTPGETKPKT
ncbi:MAG: efflux RND transporter periplasmic adaptor subunit [Akkermansiaceae bacterium]|nr:efflux RND transporter periplasmic adaptor subunit [Akkermansiaceae bacterium]MDG2322794.1 efflux RND transporter periplasmic adaptor subunit [Akkermansiaceae bacterium]